MVSANLVMETYKSGPKRRVPKLQTQLLYSPTYIVILSVLDPRKCEYLKDYSLDFEHAYMTTYLAS